MSTGVNVLPSGRFRARYRAPSGRWVSKTFDREGDAKRWRRSELTKLDHGSWTDPGSRRVPLGDWTARWVETLTGLEPKTLAGYKSLLATHVLPRLGSEPLETITPAAVQTWIADLEKAKLSPSRIRQARQVLNAVLEAAVAEGLLARNPVRGTRQPRTPRREMLVISPEVLERIVAEVSPPHDLVILTLAYSGMRWGELAALRRRRVDVLGRHLHVVESLKEIDGSLIFGATKTHRDRMIAMPRFLANALGEHMATIPDDPEALLFTTSTGAPLRSSNWHTQVWRPARARAGAPPELRPHDLRHFCASVLITGGSSPMVVARQLGHSSPRVTLDVYSHLFPTDLESVADRLEGVRSEAIASHARHEAAPRVTSITG